MTPHSAAETELTTSPRAGITVSGSSSDTMISMDPGVWRSIECFRLDQSVVATKLLQQARGQLPAKRVRRCTLQLQERLRKLCVSIRDGGSDTAHFLRAVGHSVRLCKE